MRHFFRRVVRATAWGLGGVLALVAVLIVTRLSLNLLHAETRGARPLPALASGGEPRVREAARAVLAHLGAEEAYRSIEWVAVVNPRSRGDTVEFGLFRAQDATLLSRMLMPDPYVSGRALYDTGSHRLILVGAGVR